MSAVVATHELSESRAFSDVDQSSVYSHSLAAHVGYTVGNVRVAVIDDEQENIELLELYLREAGYQHFLTTTDSVRAIEVLHNDPPDVVFLDLLMPCVNGFEVLDAMRKDPALRMLPVIILSADATSESKLKALELGVHEFLAKPVDPSELLLRLRNTLCAKALQDHLADYSAKLEREITIRIRELESSRQEAIHCLARAAEYRDDDTGKHVLRVGRYVALIATQLGFSRVRCALLEQASQLHDVGKIGIPDSILLKCAKLDPEEFEMIKEHCAFGKKIIEPSSDADWKQLRNHTEIGRQLVSIGSSPIMRLAAIIAETHHEKWDGSGYPSGLVGEAIPIEGRITAVADVFDALSSERPYKEAFSIEKSLAILNEGRGTHFDPRVVDAFLQCLAGVLRIKQELAE